MREIIYSKSYEFCYKLANDTNWISVSQATAKCTIHGLESGGKYDFRVAYVGKKTTKVYSDVLSIFIL